MPSSVSQTPFGFVTILRLLVPLFPWFFLENLLSVEYIAKPKYTYIYIYIYTYIIQTSHLSAEAEAEAFLPAVDFFFLSFFWKL